MDTALYEYEVSSRCFGLSGSHVSTGTFPLTPLHSLERLQHHREAYEGSASPNWGKFHDTRDGDYSSPPRQGGQARPLPR